ncbi:MAG TPA: MCE family protein [candidate division WOR-3 bacterium]|uniref:MCE family protein n=1 Tax=candidate division WOR-3 bacterium TaxID=2052148 RepID=A0A9C9EMX0_UNCW3|nr:MCE family protein [candidate division WOR-3 bacterium]
MAKQIKTTLVGIFIIAGIILFVVLYTWLSGKISMRNTYDIVVYFQDVTGLKTGDPVLIYGIEKGKVKALDIDSGRVRVVLAIERDLILPEDSKIAVRSISYIGSDRFIKITPGKGSKKAVVYQGENETLDLEALIPQFDSLISFIKELKPEELTDMVTRLSKSIDKSIKELSSMLKQPTKKLGDVVDKIEHVVDELDSLSVLLKGDGTVGRLLKSDELYQEVRGTNQELKELIKDIRENPQKYINVKIF